MGIVLGAATTSYESGPYPKATYAAWVKARVRAVNSLNQPGSYSAESAAYAISALAGTSVPAPNPPTGVIIAVAPKEERFGLHIGWAPPSPAGGTIGYEIEVRYFTDWECTLPDSSWISLGSVSGLATDFMDTDFWPRPEYTVVALPRVRGVNSAGEVSAWAQAADPTGVGALVVPPTPSANSSTVQIADRGGVPSYRFHVAVTAAADPGTTSGYVAQARFYSDAGATIPVSDWIDLGWFPSASDPLDTDYWPRPEVTQYAKVRIAGQNVGNALGPWIESAVLTVQASTGLDPAMLDPAGLGNGVVITGGVLQSTDAPRDISNKDFEYWSSSVQPKDWTYQYNCTQETVVKWSGSYSVKHVYQAGGNPNLHRWLTVAPGTAVRFTVMARSHATLGNPTAHVVFADSSFTGLAGYAATAVNDGAWHKLEVVGTAPANTAYMLIHPLVYWDGCGPGHAYVDQCELEMVTPVAGSAGALTSPVFVFVGPNYDTNGIPHWRMTTSWAAETATVDRARVELVWFPAGSWPVPLGTADIAAGGIESPRQAYPSAALTGTFRMYVLSRDGIRGAFSDAVIPVPVAPSGTLRASEFDPSTFETAEFQVTGGKFNAKLFSAEKIYVGSILRVGGGTGAFAPNFAGNANGQIAVYNAANQLRAWMGQNGAIYGGWFGELYAGGADPSSAPFTVDSTGKLQINMSSTNVGAVPFRLTLSGIVTEITNGVIDGGFAGLVVKNLDNSYPAIVSPGRFSIIPLTTGGARFTVIGNVSGSFLTMYADNSVERIRLSASNVGGSLTLRNSAAGITLQLSGSDGSISAGPASFSGAVSATSLSLSGSVLANQFLASPTFTGAPSFRGIQPSDLSVAIQNLTAFVNTSQGYMVGFSTVIDSSRQLVGVTRIRYPDIGSEAVNFTGFTTVRVLYIYNSSGTYMGKCPIYA
jgi:hypothetical protein